MNSQCHNEVAYYQAHRGDCSDDKGNLLFSADDFQQAMCVIIGRDVINISWFMKKADRKLTLFYTSPPRFAACNVPVIR